MVAEACNAYVDILRGVTYDACGDITDSGTTAAFTGVPAILAETSHTTMDPATQTPRTIRSVTLKLPWYTKARTSDQIRNTITGDLYAVIDVTAPPTTVAMPAGGPPDLLLTLRRITSTGT